MISDIGDQFSPTPAASITGCAAKNKLPISISWKTLVLLVPLALAACFCPGAATAAGRVPLSFMLPMTAVPPAIDGVIDDAEWKDAVVITGVAYQNPPRNNTYSVRQATYWLTWDAQHFYVAMRSPLLPGEKLHRAVRGKARDDGELIFDDNIEMYFYPKSYPQRVYSFYQLIINSVNRIIDTKCCPTIGQNYPDWTADCRMMNRVTPDGKYWEAEVALNAASLEINQPMKDGEQWFILMARNFASPWAQVSLPMPPGSGYFDPQGYPRFTLASDVPVVKCYGFGDILQGHLAPAITIVNPTANPATLHYVLSALKGSTAVTNANVDVTLAPGAEQQPVLKLDLAEAMTGDVYTAELLITQDGKQIYHDWVPFQINPSYLRQATRTRPQTSYAFKGNYNPVRDSLAYTIDIIDLPQKARFAYATVTVCDAKGKEVASGRAAKMIEDQSKAIMLVPVLSLGAYTVESKLFAADDAVLGTQSFSFTKLDEASEFPWYKNDIGITEECFYPFTPLTVNKDVVTCWNRTVTFDGVAMPHAILAGGGSLLASGIALFGSFGGQTRQCTPTQPLQVTKARTGRVEMTGGGTLAGLSVRTQTAMELDGFTLIKMSLTPKDQVKLNQLYIDLPLSAKETQLFMAMGTDYVCKQVPQHEGTIWTSRDMKINAMSQGNFIPQVWMGNYQRGLCWFADDDRGWVPNDHKPALEIIRSGETVTLRMNLISEPYVIDKPRTVTFGVIASPMKPITRGLRLTEVGFGDTFGAVGMDNANWSSVIPNQPYEASKQQVDAKMQNWPYLDAAAKVNPCICAGWVCTSDRKTLNYFNAEMGDASLTRTAQDHYVYYLREWERKSGVYGIYHDCMSPRLYRNLDDEMAYALPDGTIQPGWDVTYDREFLKRLWVMFLQDGKTPPDIRANGGGMIPSFGFLSNLNTGECSMFVTESYDNDIMDFFTPEYMQFFNPDTWGMNTSWMGANGNWIHADESTPKGREVFRHHNTVLTGISYLDGITRINDGAQNPTAQLARWGMGKTDVVFHPYWEAMDFAKCETPTMKMSAWTRPDKALFVVVNTAHANGTAALTLDFKKMGLWPKQFEEYLGVYNLTTDRTIPFDAFTGKVTVNIPEREYALIAVEKY